MRTIAARLARLEGARPAGGVDPDVERLVAACPSSELRVLLSACRAHDERRPLSEEQAAAVARLDEQLHNARYTGRGS